MQLSFVLLARPYDVDGAAIVASHARLFAAAPRPLVSSSAGAMAELRFADGLTTHVALMPAPVPDGEADGAARFSLAAFRRDGGAVAPHAAHLIVTTHSPPRDASGRLDPLVRHTRIVAACVDAYRAVAVYEGNAGATHPAAFYLDVATSSDVPLMLWTGISVAQEPDGPTSILSLGAEATVGIPDMIVSAPPARGNDPLVFLFDMLSYVASRGAPLPDGDTVGRNADERLRVHYVASPIDPASQVARIDLA
jgi:hypothetical protein